MSTFVGQSFFVVGGPSACSTSWFAGSHMGMGSMRLHILHLRGWVYAQRHSWIVEDMTGVCALLSARRQI